MRETPAMQKLRSLGYMVKQVPIKDLPFYLQHQVRETNEHFFKLQVADHQIFNKSDSENGYFLAYELTGFADRLPKVTQPSLMEALDAPF